VTEGLPAIGKVVAFGLAVVIVLVVLDRFLLWCESRGWIYWRRRRASPGTAAAALLELQAMMEPGKEQVLKETRRVHEERDDAGEPPEPPRPS
jgi:hypothetical protein